MGNKKYMQIKVNKHYYRINRTEDNLSPSGIILSRTNDSQFVEILDNDLYEMGILTRLAGPKEYIERELISALLPKGKDPEILSNWCICGNNTLISCKPSAFENKSKLGLILIESQDMNKHKYKKLKFTVEAHGIDSDLINILKIKDIIILESDLFGLILDKFSTYDTQYRIIANKTVVGVFND